MNMTHTDTDFYGFSADRPIESASEDLLGRSDFAKNLGEAIYNWKGKDSLVVALYGEWGSGKSSIKNMALSHLKQKESHKPTIIEFSPWEWAAQEKITKAFFDEISKAIGREDKSESNKKLGTTFKQYGSYLAATEIALSSTSAAIPTLLIILSGIGALSSFLNYQLVSFITTLLVAGIAILKWGTEVLKKASDYFLGKSEDSKKSLHEIREELSVLLKDRDSSILIVMDDLDRLTSSELRMIFQLIKANTIFPNVTFLLLFQKSIVEQKLTDPTQSGRDYLEKIIQVPINIPQIKHSKIYSILLDRIYFILDLDKSFEIQFNQKRWENIFHAGLKHYFNNLRNVYRYTSTLAFHFSIFKGRKVFEVNSVDLISIECIRVFEPDVYTEISLNRLCCINKLDADVVYVD